MPYEALMEIGQVEAVKSIARYFSSAKSGRPNFTGSQFETFAGGGDADTAYVIDSSDLIAVGLLAIHVPGQAALGIIEGSGSELSNLLHELPHDLRFEDLDENKYKALLGPQGPAQQAWDILRQNGGKRWGVGPTTASKILARKRPHLIPIYDSVVAKQTGLNGSGAQWDRWFAAFSERRDSEMSLKAHLEQIREASGQEHLSLLRVLDIALWMSGNGPSVSEETVGERDE